MSTESTTPGPAAAAAGRSRSTTGRLLITLASTAATTAASKSDPSDVVGRDQVHDKRTEPVERNGLHHTPEGQHEGEEGDVEGEADIAGLGPPVHQRRHGQGDSAAEGGVDMGH